MESATIYGLRGQALLVFLPKYHLKVPGASVCLYACLHACTCACVLFSLLTCALPPLSCAPAGWLASLAVVAAPVDLAWLHRPPHHHAFSLADCLAG